MLAEELNAALTDEKLRVMWLKRLLPGIAITVIYFVFISGILSDKANKAENAYTTLVNKGVSAQAQQTLQQRYNLLLAQLNPLRKRDAELLSGLPDKDVFLSSETRNMYEVVSKITNILRHFDLYSQEEHSLGEVKISGLPTSFADISQWLADANKSNTTTKLSDSAHLHRFVFNGLYTNAYQALKELALSDIKAMPVYFSMQQPDPGSQNPPGTKRWTLDCWI